MQVKRVDLLVTGRTEAEGMALALQRLFPQHQFQCVLQNQRDGVPFPSFTSTRLPGPKSHVPSAVRKVVQATAGCLVPDKRREPPDFLFVLDDLELVNADQPVVVAEVFAAELRQHLAELESFSNQSSVQRVRNALRDKASLHFVNPMVEAWFFADPAALSTCGASPDDVLQVCKDPEDFETDDAQYLVATESECPKWQSLRPSLRKKQRPKWLGQQNRARHPKGYLQWLCRDEFARNCTSYRETSGGRALAGLDWATIQGRADGQLTYLRALIADLADALDDLPVTGPIHQKQAPVTSRFDQPRYPVLRNL